MQKVNNENNQMDLLIDAQSSKAPSSQELEFDTQSFTSKEDIMSQPFKPFQNERDSTGKLIQNKHLNFLKGQEIVLLNPTQARQRYSTTSLLGLHSRAITADEQKMNKRAKLKNFKLHLTADQGFIKQFREIKKQVKPSTQMNSGFLGPKRDYYYKSTKTPGPGVYQGCFMITQQPIEFPKSPQMIRMTKPNCSKDFYNVNIVKKNINVPSFERTQSRDSAYQKGIFAQIEIEKRQLHKQKPEEYDDQKLDRDIEYLLYQQQKYEKTNHQSIDWSVPLRKLEQPEKFHGQWTKMLEHYGFKKLTGGRLIKNYNFI